MLVQVCARTHLSFEMKKYELATSNKEKRRREEKRTGERERLLNRENNIDNV